MLLHNILLNLNKKEDYLNFFLALSLRDNKMRFCVLNYFHNFKYLSPSVIQLKKSSEARETKPDSIAMLHPDTKNVGSKTVQINPELPQWASNTTHPVPQQSEGWFLKKTQ